MSQHAHSSSSLSKSNSSIRSMRENQRKQIRRQYIQKYTKNKRKQLLESNSSYAQYFSGSVNANVNSNKDKSNNKKQLQIQNQYHSYLHSFSYQLFASNPNNHLQLLVEINGYQKCSQFRQHYVKMLIIVHNYMMNRLNQQHNKILHLKQELQQQQRISKINSINNSNNNKNKNNIDNHNSHNNHNNYNTNNPNYNNNKQYSNTTTITQLMSEMIINLIGYNQVFFQPYSNNTQSLYFATNPFAPLSQLQGNSCTKQQKQQQIPYNSSYQTNNNNLNNNNQSQNHNLTHTNSKKISWDYNIHRNKDNPGQQQVKLNINLLLQFYIGIIFELTPEMFVQYGKQCLNTNNANYNNMNNGYNQLIANSNNNKNQFDLNNLNSQSNNQQQKTVLIHQFLDIYNDVYQLSISLFKMAHNIRYNIGSLQQIYHHLIKVYQNNQNGHYNLKLPNLNFNVQKMFLKQSTIKLITLRSLQIIINITSLTQSKHPQYDQWIKSLVILKQLDEISNQVGLIREEINYIAEIYSNLVEEEIQWYRKYRQGDDKGNTGQRNEIEDKMSEQYMDNQHILSQPPGIYPTLLQQMSENASQLSQFNQISYILIKILDNYQILPPEQDQMIQKDAEFKQAESRQLILAAYYCEKIAGVIATMMFHIACDKQNLSQIQHLPKLFILICQKFLPYLINLTSVGQLLGMIIRNENKRFYEVSQRFQSKYYKQKLSNKIITQTEQSQKKLVKQNIRQIIKYSGMLLSKLFKQAKKIQTKNDCFLQMDLDAKVQIISQDIIDKILQLWDQNQLQNCIQHFTQFIRKAVKYFPQKLILTRNGQKFVLVLQQLASNGVGWRMIEILENILNYINSKRSKSDQQQIAQYFHRNRSQFDKILQCVEGEMYNEKNIENQQGNKLSQIFNKQNPFSTNQSKVSSFFVKNNTKKQIRGQDKIKLLQYIYDQFQKHLNYDSGHPDIEI